MVVLSIFCGIFFYVSNKKLYILWYSTFTQIYTHWPDRNAVLTSRQCLLHIIPEFSVQVICTSRSMVFCQMMYKYLLSRILNKGYLAYCTSRSMVFCQMMYKYLYPRILGKGYFIVLPGQWYSVKWCINTYFPEFSV